VNLTTQMLSPGIVTVTFTHNLVDNWQLSVLSV